MPDYTRTGATVAGAASAVAFGFGTGLEPLWPLAWLAPFPVLLVAARAPAWLAFVMALAAWAFGHLHLWPFLHGVLRVPAPIVVLLIVVPAIVFALVVLVWRAHLRRRRSWWGALAVPALWTSVEFAVARLSAHGTAGSLAYAQMDVLPIVQLASVTGLWGVTFLVMAVPAAAAAAVLARSSRWMVTITAVLLTSFPASSASTRLATRCS